MKSKLLMVATCLLLSLPAYSLDIVTNIKPLQLITLALAAQGDEVNYIIPPQASPHTYRVRPSAIRRVEEADLVIWTKMETSWESIFSVPGSSLETLAALGLKAEEHEAHEKHEAHKEHEAHEEHEEHHHHGIDPHVWLSPNLASRLASLISIRLKELNPAQAAVYDKKLAQFHKGLAAAKSAIETKLAPVRHKKFYTMHDAYGYFTAEFGLATAGAITLSPEVPLSARHLSEVRSAMETGQIACVFAEPQMNSAPILKLMRETDVRFGVLDPLAAEIEENENGYLHFLHGLADSIVGCLGSSPSH